MKKQSIIVIALCLSVVLLSAQTKIMVLDPQIVEGNLTDVEKQLLKSNLLKVVSKQKTYKIIENTKQLTPEQCQKIGTLGEVDVVCMPQLSKKDTVRLDLCFLNLQNSQTITIHQQIIKPVNWKKAVKKLTVFTIPTMNMQTQTQMVVEEKTNIKPISTLKTLTVNNLKIDMIYVEGGTFMMGSTSEQTNPDDDEKPVHEVDLNSYYIGKTEVTVSQFAQFIKATNYRTDADKIGRSYVWDGKEWVLQNGINWQFDAQGKLRDISENEHPVIHVSWNDAKAYCEWLSQQVGAKISLPTEAQWEYAARGGKNHQGFKYSGSNTINQVAVHSLEPAHTVPVATKTANELGIYDMTGNVWEWCHDWYSSTYYGNSPKQNPDNIEKSSYCVLRGGSWRNGALHSRVAYRYYTDPIRSFSAVGFRITMSE